MPKKRKWNEEEVTDEVLDLILDDVIDLVAEEASREQELMEEMMNYEQSVMNNLEKEADQEQMMDEILRDEKAMIDNLEKTAFDQDHRIEQEIDDAQSAMNELERAAFEQARISDDMSDYARSLVNEWEAAFEDLTEDEVFDYEQSKINHDLMNETWLMKQDLINHEGLNMAEELIRGEELDKDEILGTESGWSQHLEDEDQLMEQLWNEIYEETMHNEEMEYFKTYPPGEDWSTREEQWSLMNTEWFNEDHHAGLLNSKQFAISRESHEEAAMEERINKMKKKWIMIHGKSIMNEKWRTILDDLLDQGLMMDEEYMKDYLPSLEIAMAAEHDSWNEEAMAYHQSTWNEVAIDYEQSIMNEMTGWYNIDSAKSGQLTSKFDYTHLDQPDHEIRIVRLHPRRWPTDPIITCDITTVHLITAPRYEALSYEWGSPSNKEYTIQLNQKSVAVRQNLWWALHDLRDAHKPRDLWIDALCINQYNVHERNCQVSRMGNIYSQAIRVVAWIGQDNYESRYGHAFLSELNSISPEKHCPPHGECPYGKHRAKWQALNSLCNRSYWSRLWIIQEVVLAFRLRIQCGTTSFDWEDLAEVFHYLGKRKTGSCSPRSRLSIVSSVPFRLEMQRRDQQMAKHENTNANLIPLLDLVDLFKDASCFDARDKIFGLKSLSSSCCRDAVATDYSMEYEDILDTLSAHHQAEHS